MSNRHVEVIDLCSSSSSEDDDDNNEERTASHKKRFVVEIKESDDDDDDDELSVISSTSESSAEHQRMRHVLTKSRQCANTKQNSIPSSAQCTYVDSDKEQGCSAGRKRQRRSRRGNSSLHAIASLITSGKNVVMVTGAGLSVNSGIRPFRGEEGLWSQVIWTNATREAFYKDPCAWYNNFWLKHFPPSSYNAHKPNSAHEAIAKISTLPNTNLNVITQNIDGLHSSTEHCWDYEQRLIEAHGRLGLYKCIPEEDSDTDVKLGSCTKGRALHSSNPSSSSSNNNPPLCKYESQSSIPLQSLLASHKTKSILSPSDSHSFPNHRNNNNNNNILKDPPLCPNCLHPAPPQALLFDEDYSSHSHYQFQKIKSWLFNADVLIFVGASFAVTITDIALKYARECRVPVYNFNIDRTVGSKGRGGSLESTSRLDATNITGDVCETLPKLWRACDDMISRSKKKER